MSDDKVKITEVEAARGYSRTAPIVVLNLQEPTVLRYVTVGVREPNNPDHDPDKWMPDRSVVIWKGSSQT